MTTIPDGLEDRYSRQLALPQIGPAGQQRLARSHVLVVGCGGLGSVQAALLARAGVGALRLVDRDVVERSNLHRQILFEESDADAGLPKAVAAGRRLRRIDRHLKCEAHAVELTPANVLAMLDGIDVVLDATDNFVTRWLINDACVATGRPWVYGGVLGVEGAELAIRPPSGPCLRCMISPERDPTATPTCRTRGVLNSAVALVASLQVSDAFRILLGDDGDFPMRAIDAWRGSVRAVAARRVAGCVCCGQRRFEFLEGGRAIPAPAVRPDAGGARAIPRGRAGSTR